MRARTVVIGLLQAALLVACGDSPNPGSRDTVASEQAPKAFALGTAGDTHASAQEVPASAPVAGRWPRTSRYETSRLVIRTGQASIEVDSLGPAMASLRRLVQRSGGFVADASIQSGRNQLRSATLELKVPASQFDELTEALEPIGRLQFVNVGAEDVSEEFVDLSARVANGRRLEDRLVEMLRTRTGKLQDVLTVERELARVREEIERMEGRLRFLKASAQLSTLSVNVYEPAPILASHPGGGVIGDAFRSAWRNFVGVLAVAIASLGYVVPVAALGWTGWAFAKRYRRRTA